MNRTIRIASVIAWCLVLLTGFAAPGALALSEYEVKAAYLYNFLKFINWPAPPADPHEPLHLCLYGAEAFKPVWQAMPALSVQGRPLNVVYQRPSDPVEQCDVFFISALEPGRVNHLLVQAARTHSLTVGDAKDFTEVGGIIGFIKVGNVIRFTINLKAARESGIQVSAKLLELAQDVTE